MKKRILLCACIMVGYFYIGHAQEHKYVYYFDEKLALTKEADAIIVGNGFKENGRFRVDYFGKASGNLFMSAHYNDSSLSIFEGQFTKLYDADKLKEQGEYTNGLKNGIWQKWDTLGQKTDSIFYKGDTAFVLAKFNYYSNGQLSHFSLTDSVEDTFKTTSYDTTGIKSGEVFFKGQLGILKRYNSDSVTTDSLYTREEMEAYFPGGQPGWIRYLQINLDPSTPVRKGAPAGTYKVIVKFIVAKDGSISNAVAETNFGFGMEKEVLRIIKKGPKWIPASQYGRNVNAYRRQPITFIVEGRR